MSDPNPKPVNADVLARAIAADNDLSLAHARRVLDTLGLLISACLHQGSRVRLPGLGEFKPKLRGPRSGTGPDGQPWSVPAQRVVVFTPAKALKDILAEADQDQGVTDPAAN